MRAIEVVQFRVTDQILPELAALIKSVERCNTSAGDQLAG